MRQLQEFEQEIRSEHPDFRPGDTVRVHVRIKEGDKERIQVYEGVVIRRKRAGIATTFTVRKMSYGVGVERIFPLHSPRVAKIEVVRRGDARRAKLYFLRERVGKSRRLRDQRRGLKHTQADTSRPAPTVTEDPIETDVSADAAGMGGAAETTSSETPSSE